MTPSNGAESDESSTNSYSSENGAMRDTSWGPGLSRRRRGRRDSRSATTTIEGDSLRRDAEGRSGGTSGNAERDITTLNFNSRHEHSAPGPAFNASSQSIGIENAGGSPCVAAASVGVLMSSVGLPPSTTSGGSPSTPLKNLTKDAGLVTATTSSFTTAGETAESTLMTQSPLSVRRRRSSGRGGGGGSFGSPGLMRQYHLLRFQIILLLGSALIGLILFLFYALPLAAFASLALMISSVGALIPVARSIIRARYEMELEHPLGLTRYLPDSLREMLTETTLHEFMIDTTFFMENRYLLLYFVPGLQPEQLASFIDQLPPRHQEALLQPGLGRLMPSLMGYLMRLDNNGRAPINTGLLQLENEDDLSTASGLTTEREHQVEGDGNTGENPDVTLFQAVSGLQQTLAGVTTNEGDGAGTNVAASSNSPVTHIYSVNQDNGVDHDHNPTVGVSIDLTASELGNREGQATPVTTDLPQSPDPFSNQTNDQNEEEIQQQEYDLEGRILSEAASAAIANYAAQASAAVRETGVEALNATSSLFIRAGALTGLVAGGGGIMAAVLANRQGGSTSPLSVTLGSITWPSNENSSDLSRSSVSVDRNNSNEALRQSARPSSLWIRGFFVTSALGFAGAGFAYLIRNRVRADIAASRKKRLEDTSNNGDKQ